MTVIDNNHLILLKTYQNLLETWQKKLNLVSSSSIPEAWNRHFVDSYQLISYLPPEPLTLLDIGSGAGFPGLVLAIVRQQSLAVTLVESDFKKCIFLENVSRETKTPVTILNSRIERIEKSMKGDIITARGLAPLTQLLEYAFPLMKEKSICLFLKGKDALKEIEKAQKNWNFGLEIYPSLTDSQGRILKVEHLRKVVSND